MECGFPLQGLGLGPIGEHQLLQRKHSFEQLKAERATIEFDGAKAGGGREKGFEGANGELWTKPECPLNGGITEPGQHTKQCLSLIHI